MNPTFDADEDSRLADIDTEKVDTLRKKARDHGSAAHRRLAGEAFDNY
jgi:hypothetical protein